MYVSEEDVRILERRIDELERENKELQECVDMLLCQVETEES